jgi:outer membrane immunogenic protein
MKFSSVSMSVLAAAVLLASSSAFAASYKGEGNYKGEAMAQPCPPAQTLLGGFYVGGQLGYDSYRVRQNVGPTISSPAGTFLSANPAIALNGFVGGLFLGYGQYFDNFYLGAEALGNWNGSTQNWSTTVGSLSYTNKTQVNGTWGLSLLPGVKLNDATLGYLRLGYDWTNFKTNESQSSGTGPAPTTTSVSKSNSSGGFNYGLGVETLLTGNWSVRTEFTHTNYNSFNSAFTSFNPSNNQFMLGLLYHFV